jgi:hypothetical protein
MSTVKLKIRIIKALYVLSENLRKAGYLLKEKVFVGFIRQRR